MRQVLVIVFLLLFNSSKSQERIWNSYSVREGLPSANIYRCAVDNEGFIWIATESGLSRFDGIHFVNYSSKDGLSDNEVLWVEFQPKDQVVKIITFNSSVTYYNTKSKTFYTKKEKDNSLFNINRSEQLRAINPNLKLDGINNVDFKDSNYYFSTNKGLIVYNSHRKRITDTLLSDIRIHQSFFDRNGNLWIATFGKGLFSRLHNSPTIYTQGLKSKNLQAVYKDERNLYVSDDKGYLYRQRNHSLETWHYLDPKASHCRVKKIKKNKGNFYVLSDNGLWTVNSMHKANISPSTTKSFSVVNDSVLLLGEYNRFLVYDHKNKTKIHSQPIRTTSTLFYKNSFLYGTLQGLFQIKDNKVINYGQKNPYLSKTISDLASTNDGILWVATSSHGIIIQENEKFDVIDESKGLSAEVIKKLFVDEKQTVWAITNRGVSKITYSSHQNRYQFQVKNFQLSQGMHATDVNDLFVKNDSLYLATDNGLQILSDKNHNDKLEVILHGIKIENLPRKIQPSYSLKSSEDDISFQFSAVCHNCNGNLLYGYRLRQPNQEGEWRYTKNNSVDFVSLKPGKYIFEIRVENGPLTETSFSISKPFYALWWFYLLVLFLLAISLFVLYKYRVRQIEKIERTKSIANKKIADLELKLIHAKLNPHFIYNSLNAIQYYINSNEKQIANKYLVAFSKLMRSILDSSNNSLSTIQKEVEIIDTYCMLERLRFENKFDYKIDVDPNIIKERTLFPSLMIQLYAENAINHGLAPLRSNGFLNIRFTLKNAFIVCEIEDNGIGRKEALKIKERKEVSRRSWGLSLTGERIQYLKHIENLDCSVEIEDKYEDDVPKGTRVIIKISAKFTE